MRSVLATPTVGLAACLVGRPHWFFHHLGLGEPIGYSARLSMNNSTLYQNHSNLFTRAVYISLLDDPTLRLDPVGPPANLTSTVQANIVTLNWSASPDSPQGYHVYRATSPSGPFSRLTTSFLTGTSYSDINVPANTYTYMVRAVKLQTNPSGSYFNPSQGIFTTATATSMTLPITLLATRTSGGLLLSWNSQPGLTYRVQVKTNVQLNTWSNLSSSITATRMSTSWTDTNINSSAQRFYRIMSP